MRQRDKNGRYLAPQNKPKPMWPGPYDPPPKVAGYLIIGYFGYARSKDKGTHRYHVVCLGCMKTYIRTQQGLAKSKQHKKAHCQTCQNAKRALNNRQTRIAEDPEMLQRRKEWLDLMKAFSIASFEWRRETNRLFDSERLRI